MPKQSGPLICPYRIASALRANQIRRDKTWAARFLSGAWVSLGHVGPGISSYRFHIQKLLFFCMRLVQGDPDGKWSVMSRGSRDSPAKCQTLYDDVYPWHVQRTQYVTYDGVSLHMSRLLFTSSLVACNIHHFRISVSILPHYVWS